MAASAEAGTASTTALSTMSTRVSDAVGEGEPDESCKGKCKGGERVEVKGFRVPRTRMKGLMI